MSWIYDDIIANHHLPRHCRDMAGRVAARLSKIGPMQNQRIAIVVEAGFDWVSCLLAVWQIGAVAVPLFEKAPRAYLSSLVHQSQSKAILTKKKYLDQITSHTHIIAIDTLISRSNDSIRNDKTKTHGHQEALLMFTSGTTAQPKGVVWTYSGLETQVASLRQLWGWQSQDCLLSVLPLHHFHGISNVLTSLSGGAAISFSYPFNPEHVWQTMSRGHVSVFMAVPTIYHKLLQSFGEMPSSRRDAISAKMRQMRLMVSGSANLPPDTHKQWLQVSGQNLLERYGMTEIGIVIANPRLGERRKNSIGKALGWVDLLLKDEKGKNIDIDQKPGEIHIRGSGIFHRYDHETHARDPDEWFATGDLAQKVDGYFYFLGRINSDIIKSGGYKISTLEIENLIKSFDYVREAAVVGIDDDVWGQALKAFVVVHQGDYSQSRLMEDLRKSLPPYKVPKLICERTHLPKNPVGKVQKHLLK